MSIKKTNGFNNRTSKVNDSSILDSLLKNTNSSVFLQNCEFKFTKVLNPPANLKEEDFLDRTDFDILPAEQALQISKIKEDVLSAGKSFDGNLQLSFDGAQKSYNILINPLFDDNSHINGLLSTYTELSDTIIPFISSDRFSILDNNFLNSISDGVAVYKAINDGDDFIFEYMNPAGERLSHVKFEDIKGKSVRDIFPTIEKIGLLDVFREVWKTGKRGGLPLTLYKDDRVSQWVENYVYKTPNDEIIAVYSDMTEKLETEKTIRENEERLSLVLQGAQLGLWDQDFKNNKIIRNDRWYEMLGYSPTEINSDAKSFRDLVHPDDLPKLLKAVEEHESGKSKLLDVEVRVRAKNGEWLWIYNCGKIVERDKDGKPIRALGIHQDITQRKQMEEAIRNSELQLRSILDSTPFPVAMIDIDDNVIEFWSKSAQDLLGHTPPIVQEWYEIAYPDPDYRKYFIKKWKSALDVAKTNKKTINVGYYRIARHDGSIRICELYATFMNDKFIVTFNDITNQKIAENKLRESEEKFKAIFHNSPDIIALLSIDGTVIDINHSDPSSDEAAMIGSNFTEHLENDNGISFFNAVQKAVTSGKMYSYDAVTTSPNGEKIYWFIKISPIKNKDSVSQLVVDFTNISQLKKYEEQLRNQLTEMDYLYRSSPIGLGLIDKNLCFLRVNENLAKSIGISVENLIGMPVNEILRPGLTSLMVPSLKRVIKNKKAEIELEIREEIPGENNPNLRDWLVSHYPVETSSGDLLGVGIVVQDITDIKIAKKELEMLNNQLFQERIDLQFKNVALREVMNQIEEEKKEMAHNMQLNIDKSITPMFERLEKQLAKKEKAYLTDIQKELEHLTSPYLNQLTSAYSDLSTRDIEICNLIKNGHSSKEIAEYFKVSEEAIRSRRKIIRKKIKIASKDINLATYLQSLK